MNTAHLSIRGVLGFSDQTDAVVRPPVLGIITGLLLWSLAMMTHETFRGNIEKEPYTLVMALLAVAMSLTLGLQQQISTRRLLGILLATSSCFAVCVAVVLDSLAQGVMILMLPVAAASFYWGFLRCLTLYLVYLVAILILEATLLADWQACFSALQAAVAGSLIFVTASAVRQQMTWAELAAVRDEAHIKRYERGQDRVLTIQSKGLRETTAALNMLASGRHWNAQVQHDVVNSIHSLQHGLNDLRLTSQKTEEPPVYVRATDMRELLSEVDRQAKPLLADRQIRFQLDEIKLPAPIYHVDALRLRSTLLDICMLIYSYSESTTVLGLTVFALTSSDARHWLVFRFTSDSPLRTPLEIQRFIAASEPQTLVEKPRDINEDILGHVIKLTRELGGNISTGTGNDAELTLEISIPASSASIG